MSSIKYISSVANGLIHKYNTRNPFEICKNLGIQIRLKDLGESIKAYYFYHSRIRNIVLNLNTSETIKRILVAHELGHDRLHKEIAILKGFKEIELFGMVCPLEYEANLFTAELLIDDNELLEMLSLNNGTFFDIAHELNIPPEILDFKFRVMKYKGHKVDAPFVSSGDFLKNMVGNA